MWPSPVGTSPVRSAQPLPPAHGAASYTAPPPSPDPPGLALLLFGLVESDLGHSANQLSGSSDWSNYFNSSFFLQQASFYLA